MPYISQNPATEEIVARFEELTDNELELKLTQARAAFKTWRRTSFGKRAELMRRAAEIILTGKQKYAELITLEMGKPISAAVAEVVKCSSALNYYADQAEKFLAEELVATENKESLVRFDPLGPVLAVMPWNFPFWQVMRFAAPAIMAGNVGLLKHASNVPQCALALEEVFTLAGFPPGVFTNLLIGSARVKSVLEDDRVVAAALTGSEYAGSLVAAICGSQIKKTVLELGGSDPFIILADADLELAAELAVSARLQNAGQSCIAAKRFIVAEEIYEQFLKLFKQKFLRMVMGDPMNPATNLGPLATAVIRTDLEKQISASLKEGARLICGGERVLAPGYFFEPTILADVTMDMTVAREETFGPVAAVLKVKNAEEAVAVANQSRFGLGAALFTTDINLAKHLATQIEAGAVFINSSVKSDARLPFGGIKKSGYGRELSRYGILEFVNIKTVVVT